MILVPVANAASAEAALSITALTPTTLNVRGTGFPINANVVLVAKLSACSGQSTVKSAANGAFSAVFEARGACKGSVKVTATSGTKSAMILGNLPGAPGSMSPNPATLPAASTSGKIFLGAAIEPDQLDDAAFVAALKTYKFDSLTAENAMKQQNIHPTADEYNWEGADKIVDFAQANNMRVRGHTLLWYRDPPSWLDEVGAGAPAQAAMKAHIQAVVGRYKGKIAQWDVVNEAMEDDGSFRADDPWRQKVGENYIELAFQYAHEADPEAVLFYNEFSAESRDLDGNGGTGRAAKSDAVYKMVQGLKAKGIPIGGVGLQTHSSGQYPGTQASLTANIKRLTALGVKVEITELDVKDAGDESGKAKRYGEVGAACKAGGCTGVTTWGLYDGHTWLDGEDPLMLDSGFKAKPSYTALTKAIGRS